MDFSYIDNDRKLADFCRPLNQCDWIGIDTEFLREKTYYAKLCLVQIASEDRIACIDPLAIDDLGPLADLLVDPGIVKVLHAARQDIEVLFQALTVLPRPIFDTQLAANLCGLGDQLGYAALTETVTGRRLAKAHTRADWSLRPIDPDALAYAADDVRYLGALHDYLAPRLDASGRQAWLEADMALLADAKLYLPDPDAAWRRVRGQNQLTDPNARGALRALAAWRERRAVRKDRPRRWIMADDTLVELAGRLPRSAGELTGITRIGGLLKAGCGEDLLAAVASRMEHPLPPTAGATPTVEERAIARQLGQKLRERAAQLDISPALLANRKQLEQLVQGERDLPVLGGWRREVVGDALLKAMTNETIESAPS
jgi:ribonuclease D